MAFWRWLVLVSGGLLALAGLVVAAALPVQMAQSARRGCGLARATNEAVVDAVLRSPHCASDERAPGPGAAPAARG